MNVRVKGQGLRPGVEDGDRAGQGSESTLADVMERLEGGLEQERIAAASISQEERMQRARHREDQVEVLHGEQAARLGFHPPGLLQALALGAVSVAAGVV